MIAEDTYKRFAKFYDMYVQDFMKDIPAYFKICEGAEEIIEIGSGTGRLLKPLLDSGHRMTGVDISDAMMSIAEKKLSSYNEDGMLKLIKHNFTKSSISKQFDRVLVTFYTFNYITREYDQLSFLKNVFESMKPNGIIAIDLFYPLTMAKPELEDKWSNEKRYFLNGLKVLMKDKRKMTGEIEERIQIFTQEEISDEIKTYRRFVSKKSIYRLLIEAGFSNVSFVDGYDYSSLHELAAKETTTGNFIVVAEKIFNEIT